MIEVGSQVEPRCDISNHRKGRLTGMVLFVSSCGTWVELQTQDGKLRCKTIDIVVESEEGKKERKRNSLHSNRPRSHRPPVKTRANA
jgi:hypothetical protein